MYNIKTNIANTQNIGVGYVNGNTTIFVPFDPDNTDYQQFKKDLANGVELKDANNTVMTTEQVAEFLATLP